LAWWGAYSARCQRSRHPLLALRLGGHGLNLAGVMAFSACGNAYCARDFLSLSRHFFAVRPGTQVRGLGELLFFETQRIVGVPVFCLACRLMKQSGTFLEESYEFDDQRSSS